MSPRRGGASGGASTRPRSAARSASRPKTQRPTRPTVTPPEALRRLGVSPRKSLGQHFLLDEFVLADLADACRLERSDTVLEIGAGPGGLTAELAKRAGSVVAVDIDEEMASLARRRLADQGHVCIIAADVLDYTPAELLAEGGASAPYVATGNLPYYITQPVVRRLLESDPSPERIVVLVQREVARRMVGGPGHESLLSMSIKCYGIPEPLFDVPASAFWPPPKVQSAAVRIERLPGGEGGAGLDRALMPRFFNLLRAGFSEPRKQLHNVLSAAFGIPDAATLALLQTARIDPVARAQHIELPDWRRLFDAVERAHPRMLDA
jgi:16S rRNA (adenine1518-N6/adenine1519-N6)-dimethyltransferase